MKTHLLLIATMGISLFSGLASAKDWKINKGLKFHLVYLPPVASTEDTNVNLTPVLNHMAAFEPDISNIQYSAITALGFPLPARENAEELKLYLKLYQWPRNFDVSLSSRKILDPFLLSQIPGGQEVEQYVSDRKNVLFKFASIDYAKREFSIKKPLSVTVPGTQSELDSSIPFSSIYVQPIQGPRMSSEAEQVDKSADGVRAIHQSLLSKYKKILRGFGQDEKTIFFTDLKRCTVKPEEICGLRVYSFPKSPLIFKNYLDLPMPQDPKNVYLSGLLLIKLTDYAAANLMKESDMTSMMANQEEFLKSFKPIWAHMLEIGSVFDRRTIQGGKK